MTALQEYDLEREPAQIVRGQGLCKLAAEARDKEKRGERHNYLREFFYKEKSYRLRLNRRRVAARRSKERFIVWRIGTEFYVPSML